MKTVAWDPVGSCGPSGRRNGAANSVYSFEERPAAGRNVQKILELYQLAARGSNLAGRQGVSAAAFQNLKKHWRFRLTCFGPASCRRSIVSSAFVRSLRFSGFASAMTLEMTLDAKDSLDFLQGNLRIAPRSVSTRVAHTAEADAMIRRQSNARGRDHV